LSHGRPTLLSTRLFRDLEEFCRRQHPMKPCDAAGC
jgi:hypothetical protein